MLRLEPGFDDVKRASDERRDETCAGAGCHGVIAFGDEDEDWGEVGGVGKWTLGGGCFGVAIARDGHGGLQEVTKSWRMG